MAPSEDAFEGLRRAEAWHHVEGRAHLCPGVEHAHGPHLVGTVSSRGTAWDRTRSPRLEGTVPWWHGPPVSSDASCWVAVEQVSVASVRLMVLVW